MKLSRLETETIITYNVEDSMANIYTVNKTDMKKIQKMIDAGESVNIIRQTEDILEVEVPKKWVKIRPPRKMSEEAKVAAGKRMKEYWKERNGGEKE